MNPSIEDTVASLLARNVQAEPEEMSEVYERVAPAVYGWFVLSLRGDLRSRIDAEELAQETWLRALRSLADFDSARGSFRAWLFGIARHVLMEAFQSLHSRSDGGGSTTRSFALANYPDSVTNATRRVAREDALQHFLARVGDLGEEEKVLVVCCGLEGLSTVEAAARLGVSHEAARKRWQRLRQALSAHGPPSDLLIASAD